MEVETKFNVLNEELSLQYDRNPIESIKTRLQYGRAFARKAPAPRPFPLVEASRKISNDIAGVRHLLLPVGYLPAFADAFLKRDDIYAPPAQDYIAAPKPNGYRSLHLIVETPIFLHDQRDARRVQFRTISMDTVGEP